MNNHRLTQKADNRTVIIEILIIIIINKLNYVSIQDPEESNCLLIEIGLRPLDIPGVLNKQDSKQLAQYILDPMRWNKMI